MELINTRNESSLAGPLILLGIAIIRTYIPCYKIGIKQSESVVPKFILQLGVNRGILASCLLKTDL